MALEGEKGLFAWIASTWNPYTQQVPEELKEEFINELVTLFAGNNPPDDKGYIHILMVRLETFYYFLDNGRKSTGLKNELDRNVIIIRKKNEKYRGTISI